MTFFDLAKIFYFKRQKRSNPEKSGLTKTLPKIKRRKIIYLRFLKECSRFCGGTRYFAVWTVLFRWWMHGDAPDGAYLFPDDARRHRDCFYTFSWASPSCRNFCRQEEYTPPGGEIYVWNGLEKMFTPVPLTFLRIQGNIIDKEEYFF